MPSQYGCLDIPTLLHHCPSSKSTLQLIAMTKSDENTAVEINISNRDVISSSGNVDDALRFLKAERLEGDLSDIDEKKFVRKLDWFIMPMLFSVYYLQFTDKTLRKDLSKLSKLWQPLLTRGSIIVSYAAVMGIRTDNNIDTNQYSYLALAFYVTFLFFELPQGYALQRFPISKYLGMNSMPISGRKNVFKH